MFILEQAAGDDEPPDTDAPALNLAAVAPGLLKKGRSC